MIYTFRPLELWTEKQTPAYRRRSRWAFKASWSSTLVLLGREMEHLRARKIVLQADFREQDIRQDGMIRANARQPVFPGVRVAFDSKHGPLVYATDSCVFWQHNVRSIALGLQALRAVDRYGITSRAQQYTGWKAIEAGPTAVPAQRPMTVAEAAAFIADRIDPNGTSSLHDALREGRAIEDSYRTLARRLHPDVGGDGDEFARLNEARRVLIEAHR